MAIPFALLHLIAKEFAKHAVNTAAFGLPVGNILVEIADEAMRRWKAKSRTSNDVRNRTRCFAFQPRTFESKLER